MSDKYIYTSNNYNNIIKIVTNEIKRKRANGTYQKLLDETLNNITKNTLSNRDYKILFLYEILNKFNWIYKIYAMLLNFRITSVIIKKLKLIIKAAIRKIFY